ncbi:Imidazole glycerol phosphate synthase amidotransferase subunit [Olavius algarvensis spirochete endosymbiont]|uniref:imidazole glycerol phosphate synthase subunit HisH n=1 Tax=Olavius algarvensis spirochete endosymbiont TaxID=260710 RepID=UPI000F146157|nr:imidazole glycerol phosphate synthase subunit HisH [Olavius algarvensis spirochete endosymbiont]VDB01045.1 Imidazole glycerol phosphate synthase amidotransferase subunit [Olavius algarvensis spirochete endosymbiont]
MIAVIDYGSGNLKSVELALRHLDACFKITSDSKVVAASEKVIFPGVGEARHAMNILRATHLDEALCDFAASGRVLLGICLGCQIVANHTEEHDTDLLGLLPWDVRRFSTSDGLKVPQIGWNTVIHDSSLLFEDVSPESSFYFDHSYYLPLCLADGTDSPWVAGRSEYGVPFAAAIHKDNIWATQFHPEKSGPRGLQVLRNFVERIV